MDRRCTYSVCIATYNGAQYIEEQLISILQQLTNADEVIVSDDSSKDETISIVKRLQKKYPIIKIINGPQKGFVQNFENAILNATKDIIVLSDQDDIWKENKIEKINEVFEKNTKCTTILHTMSTFCKGEDERHLITIDYHKGVISNWLKSSYWGCCMAIKREFLKKLLPFGNDCIAHDQLIGLISEKYGNVVFIDEDLIMHRLHENNETFSLPLNKKLLFRVKVLKNYLKVKKQYNN